MTAQAALHRAHPPRRALRELLRTEAKLAWRTPIGLIFGLALPVLLLVIFGSIPAFRQPVRPGSALTVFEVYVPVLICLSLSLLALISLPVPLATDRQLGVLRRFATTPVPPRWLLAAQLLINLVLAVATTAVILAGGALFYRLPAPGQPAGFVLSVLLVIAAMFAVGLLITAVAATPAVASLLGNLVLYPLLFFAGLWVPRQRMPLILQRIGDYTPLGAGVQAMQDALRGVFPDARALLVMAAYAAVFGFAAVRLFHWE